MIKSDKREINYIRQEFLRVGGHKQFGDLNYDPAVCRITPKQRRRIEHKKNHQAAQWTRQISGEPKNKPKLRRDIPDYLALAKGLAAVGRRWGKSRKDRELDALMEAASQSPLSRRATADEVEVSNAIEDEITMAPKPICPTCSAVADERCKTREGKPTRRHKNRP